MLIKITVAYNNKTRHFQKEVNLTFVPNVIKIGDVDCKVAASFFGNGEILKLEPYIACDEKDYEKICDNMKEEGWLLLSKGWEYRLFKGADRFNGLSCYSIREAYYGDTDDAYSFTMSPESVNGDSVNDVKWILENMTHALKLPVLDEYIKT
jgi:hypothetical protein